MVLLAGIILALAIDGALFLLVPSTLFNAAAYASLLLFSFGFSACFYLSASDPARSNNSAVLARLGPEFIVNAFLISGAALALACALHTHETLAYSIDLLAFALWMASQLVFKVSSKKIGTVIATDASSQNNLMLVQRLVGLRELATLEPHHAEIDQLIDAVKYGPSPAPMATQEVEAQIDFLINTVAHAAVMDVWMEEALPRLRKLIGARERFLRMHRSRS